MRIIRTIYKVARSIVFTAIMIVAGVALLTYILLSVPPVQNKIREIAQTELTKFLGGRVDIEGVSVMPFNEVVVHGLEVFTPSGEKCLRVETVGAGINIWRLLGSGEIEITYGEIIGLDADVRQHTEGGPLNIQYIIDAFAPKDKTKPPTKFDLNLRNVVLRRCKASFNRDWAPTLADRDRTDFNHLSVSDLKADIAIPRLSNDSYDVDLRRLSFRLSGGLEVEKIAFRAQFSPHSLSLANLTVRLPGTEISPSDLSLSFDSPSELKSALEEGVHRIVFIDNKITLSDFGCLVPALRRFPDPLEFSLEAEGNLGRVDLSRFELTWPERLVVEVSGSVAGLANKGEMAFRTEDLRLVAHEGIVGELRQFVPSLPQNVAYMLTNCGRIELVGSGKGNVRAGDYDADLSLSTACGNLSVNGEARGLKDRRGKVRGEVATDGIDVGRLLGKGKLGLVKADLMVDGNVAGKDFNGDASVYVSDFEYAGAEYGGIAADLNKEGKDVNAILKIENDIAVADVDVSATLSGEESWLNFQCDVSRFVPSALGLLPRYDGYVFSGVVSSDLMGNNIDNVQGEVRMNDLQFRASASRGIDLDRLTLTMNGVSGQRDLRLRSDWVDADVSGSFLVKEIGSEMKEMLAAVFPSLIPLPSKEPEWNSDVEFSVLVHPDNSWTEFFNMPFRLLVPVPVDGEISGRNGNARLSVDVPYIQQGKNKLVRESRLNVSLDGNRGSFGLGLETIFPAKKGDLSLDVNVWGEHDNVNADIGWSNPDNSSFKGMLSLGADISKDELTSRPEVNVSVTPSIFDIGPARWNIDRSSITYDDNVLSVDKFRIWHDDQFIEIDGVASALPEDSISVSLAHIDLDYIFDILKINYVTFGGEATGDIVGHGVLGGSPAGSTDNLLVRNLSYNGAVLGDGLIHSYWDNDAKEVGIRADISRNGHRNALIDGGIWVTRDSLSFGIDADKVPVDFLKPFMSAFASDVKGKASGKAKLFGTFSDIDLTGRLLADSIALKLDFTNTWYHGTDSVFLDPGHIIIPSFRLYDSNGQSAMLTGELTHRFFHDPAFNFRISDARRLLCYDTNSKMNPDWYGTIYGDGSAVVRGWPGMVAISVDMNIVGNSTFSFVLNDTEAAEDYHFLTFSDRRKEAAERAAADSVPDVLAAFRKKVDNADSTPSKFSIDIRASVGPSALMTLVMDPVAGDKITARGNGAIQLDYESDSEELQMFGKYTLDEGNYNFSLQDLILRDFSIRPGSSISFNGDPLNATLDIAAAYRVNTNLSDLDKSFSTDRDLARTNVPVDAILMVDGEMEHPDITFDIELPTLTQDVERKVKSIISTDDMMSRQIIYLLALNRFYTPEYMGSTSNGGELAAVASTTLSSQLSNMLGRLTDKFTLAPSFRSDKGDFSDLEVDVALSSRLLNNRLLVNGNFGYRDRSTSQTTFVGDFDIEYLLSRNGNLRLKAYNHFNDQNYYLREALTTQGLGVVYRRDFDNPFTFLRRKKKEKVNESAGEAEND